MPKNSLHTSLINLYAQHGDEIEACLEGYVIDILRPNELVEIQTRNFNKIKPKLERLLERYTVRLVYPIAAEKWIIRQDYINPHILIKRKSPKHGRLEDIFHELVYIPDLLHKPNLFIDVVIIAEEQTWQQDGGGSWRRRGWSIADRSLVEVYQQISLSTRQDFVNLLPQSLPDPFTSRHVAEKAGIPLGTAQKMVYCLRKMGGIVSVALPGRQKWYSIESNQT